MTRRISLSILLTTWCVLIAGGVVAYITVRWALVEQLDHSLRARASIIPELSAGGQGNSPLSPVMPPKSRRPDRGDPFDPEADHYIIRTRDGTKLTPAGGASSAVDLKLESAEFAPLPEGGRMRVLTFSGVATLPEGGTTPVTIVYQSPAAQTDLLLSRLALVLALFGMGAGLITALVARIVSKIALRPLRTTAEVIGTIEPRNLDRRIDGHKLPPELAPMADRLNEMLERIERAYAQRQQFLADASHELRTPVAAMVTTAEVTLRKPRGADEYRAAVESCLGDARLLRQLVERLMEQCRAETLSHDEPVVEVDLVKLLSQCADHAAALGEARQIKVIRNWPSACIVSTQPGRIRGIVQNLVANAVEHNRTGGTVELCCSPSVEQLSIDVRDTGPGIPAEHLPHLFEPFYRVDRARSHEAGHMGLGLALVQAHLHALKGNIRVESVVGQGTTFHVTIPLPAAATT